MLSLLGESAAPSTPALSYSPSSCRSSVQGSGFPESCHSFAVLCAVCIIYNMLGYLIIVFISVHSLMRKVLATTHGNWNCVSKRLNNAPRWGGSWESQLTLYGRCVLVLNTEKHINSNYNNPPRKSYYHLLRTQSVPRIVLSTSCTCCCCCCC